MTSSKSRAQVAMEFVMLVSVLFFVMILFIAFIRDYMVDVRDDQDRELLKDIAYAIQIEINVAADVDDGYERNFVIPEKIDSKNYTINITSQQIWARTNDDEFVLDIPYVVGQINHGGNTIRKTSGIVYINVGVENDTDSPVVTLISPSDTSTDTDGDIQFAYQVSDLDSGIANCSLIFNGSINQTGYGVVEGIGQYFYLNDLAEATYNWTVNCTDDSPSNNTGQATDWSFDVALVYNDPPTLPDSISCDDATCDASFTDSVNITCGGSTDAEGDVITYYIDAMYATANFTLEKIEAESGSFSYSGGYSSTTSCICNSPSGNCIRDSTWSPGTLGSATYTSTLGDTANRAYIYYCSENDGDDSYEIYSNGSLVSSWTTSYSANEWEFDMINDLGLPDGKDLEINCSRGTSSSYCRVDYVLFDTRQWSNIGTHGENGTFTWNISGYPDQDQVDLRCRAVDENGSGVNSSYYDPLIDMNITAGGGGGGASGSTLNPTFGSDTSYWSGHDWDYGSWEVNPIQARSTNDGNPIASVYVYFGSGRNDEVGGYWEQDFEVTVNNPSNVACYFDWRVGAYDATPNTYQAYVFLDDSSGSPTIGEEVWSSGEQTSTTTWSSESVDCSSKVTNAGTYYFKLAVWLETNGWPNDGPYWIYFDNAQINWTE